MPVARDPYTSMAELDRLIGMMPPDPEDATNNKPSRMKIWRAGNMDHLRKYMRDYRRKQAANAR